MKRALAACLVAFVALTPTVVAEEAAGNRPERLEWSRDLGFGLFVHWSLDSQVTSVISHSMVGASDAYLERYATELFNAWGIGSERRNYGMLLLVSKGDRKARIELGADWGHRYDSDAKKVMDTLIIPMFKRGQFPGGILAGARTEIDLTDVLRRRLQLIGSVLRARSRAEKARLIADFLAFARDRLDDGRLRPVIHKVYPFADIAQAYAQMEEGGVFGKLVLSSQMTGLVQSI